MNTTPAPSVRYVIATSFDSAKCFAVPAAWVGTAIDLLRFAAEFPHRASCIAQLRDCDEGWYVSRDASTGAVEKPSDAILAIARSAEILGRAKGVLCYDVLDAAGIVVETFLHDEPFMALGRAASPTYYDKAPLSVRPVVCGAA